LSTPDADHAKAILSAANELDDIVALGKSDFECNRIPQRAAERLLE